MNIPTKLKSLGIGTKRTNEVFFKNNDMYYIIQSADRWIFFSLAIIVLILLAMVFKYVFKPVGITVNSGPVGNQSNTKQPENTDFFTTKRANIGKTTSIFVENENKHYYLIDMGNNKVMIMEEEYYEPEARDEKMTKEFVGVGNIVVNDFVEVSPDLNEDDKYMADQILNENKENSDADEMKKIIEDKHRAYMDDQKNLFNAMENEIIEDEEGLQDEDQE
jgi:hypothetical protein